MDVLTKILWIVATIPVCLLFPVITLRRSAEMAGFQSVWVSWGLFVRSPRYLWRRVWWRRYVQRFFFSVSVQVGMICALAVFNLMMPHLMPYPGSVYGLGGLLLVTIMLPSIFGTVMFGSSIELANRVCAARGRVCPRCTYDLSNNAPSETMVCSECGYAVPIGEIVRGWKSLAYLPGACEVSGDERGSSASGSER